MIKNKNFSLKSKKVIVFGIIGFALIHLFIFISILSVNVPIYEDWRFIPFVVSVKEQKPLSELEFIWQINEQRPIVPQILMAINTIVFSWNLVYQMYFGWLFFLVAIVSYYFLVKKTDSRLWWIVIPMSFFVLNTSQYQNILWGFTSVTFPVAMTAALLSIFFINKTENKYSLLIAISFAFIASFTQIIGIAIWFIGFLAIIYHKNKKTSFLVWSVSAIACILLYFTGFEYGGKAQVQWNTIFSFDFVGYFLSLLASGLIPHVNILEKLRVILGSSIMIIIIAGTIITLTKLNRKKFIPWIQIALLGVCASLIITLGRIEITQSFASRYVTWTTVSQISSIFFAAVLYIYFLKRTRLSLIFLVFIGIMIICLCVSYYAGWVGGHNHHQETSNLLDCVTNPVHNYVCYYMGIEDPVRLEEYLKMLKENNLAMFSVKHDFEYIPIPLLNDSNWENMTKVIDGEGEIESIHDKQITPEKYYDSINSIVPITGWGTFGNDTATSAFVFVDGNVNSKADYGYIKRTTYNNSEQISYTTWRGFIDNRHLLVGCHDISVRIVKENQFYEIGMESKICIK